jgi:hypothetical protein
MRRILCAVVAVLIVATAADQAQAFGWATVWQAVQKFARDVAVSFVANEASRVLRGDEVAELRTQLATLQSQVQSHYGSAPTSEYDEARRLLREAKTRLDTIEQRLDRAEGRLDNLENRMDKLEGGRASPRAAPSDTATVYVAPAPGPVLIVPPLYPRYHGPVYRRGPAYNGPMARSMPRPAYRSPPRMMIPPRGPVYRPSMRYYRQ